MDENAVRGALAQRLLADPAMSINGLKTEMRIPETYERADLASFGKYFEAFEIKTERDSLRRIERQAGAYSRVFDRCTAVVAEKHVGGVLATVPDWWGLWIIVPTATGIIFDEYRAPSYNPAGDANILVQLLWRDEARSILNQVGLTPAPRAARTEMWSQISQLFSLSDLRQIVSCAYVDRQRFDDCLVEVDN